jgi:hypothetical protein
MKMRFMTGVLLSALIFLSCGKEEDGFSIPSGTAGGGNSSPNNGAKEISVPAGTFKVDLTSPIYSTHLLHKAGTDFEEPCAIDPAATGANRFIECEVEVDELDLLMYGFSFNATISSYNCQHVSYKPYYYLSAPAGVGPTAVSIVIDKDTGADTQDPNGFSVNSEPYCPFDYSYIDGGPNCCTGKYVLTKTTIENGNDTVDVSEADWGGKIGNCISGAGTLDPINDEGWPKTIYTPNGSTPGTGLLISKSYPSIFSNFKARTIFPRSASNAMVAGADHPAVSGFSFLSTFYANYYDPAVWTTGAPDAMISPYYEITCLDSAHEETAQIRLIVREWNIKDSISPTNIAASNTMGYDSNGRPNNDMGDWDDLSGIVNPTPAPYNNPPIPEDFFDIREGFPYFHIQDN